MGSAAHLRPRPGQTAYAAAKAGLEGVARSAACELGRFGVRVNVCTPGFIGAGMTLSSESRKRADGQAAVTLCSAKPICPASGPTI